MYFLEMTTGSYRFLNVHEITDYKKKKLVQPIKLGRVQLIFHLKLLDILPKQYQLQIFFFLINIFFY